VSCLKFFVAKKFCYVLDQKEGSKTGELKLEINHKLYAMKRGKGETV